MARNIGASVYEKLRNVSREKGIDMQSLLRLYAQQRLLYRISVSECAPQFCLKGGIMLAAHNGGDMVRPTDDMDFNGFGEGGIAEVEAALRSAATAAVPEDGVRFEVGSMKVLKDREGNIPGGKVVLDGFVHTARVRVRVDVGFGNVITPGAHPMEIPTLLPDVVPRPVIAGYPLETIVSEKLHAIAQFGDDNTRHKDYYDIWRIAQGYEIDGGTLCSAVVNTFAQQGRVAATAMPGLSDRFAMENVRAWTAFTRKTGLKDAPDMTEAILDLRAFLVPAITGACSDSRWMPGEGWSVPVQALSMR